MSPSADLEKFAPPFQADQYSEKDQWHLAPFFTNLDRSVYVPLIFAPELIGALCSRASRAAGDLRTIYLKEYVYPFVESLRDEKDTDNTWREKVRYGEGLKAFIEFLHKHSTLELFSNPRARSFYAKWLAEYGDDSIAQMAGSHLVYGGISQVAIKHIEDQRIGIAPIEKSTRYVNYSQKINGRYLYYTDPVLKDLGLEEEYRGVMDGLFETNAKLVPKMIQWLSEKFPEEKPSVIEKKAFDVLRGLLPTSTLSQVSFFGNGQAFEYMISRSLKHPLGEIRWAGERAYEELFQETPSFLRRIKDEEKREIAEEYQRYLAERRKRMAPVAEEFLGKDSAGISLSSQTEVKLVESDPEGENKVITGMLYDVSHKPWQAILDRVRNMSTAQKERVLSEYLKGRAQRWQKIGRALENTYNRFEIVMNIGAWRDLHRHRLLTQQRQYFSCHHGYDIPKEVLDAGLEKEFRDAIDPVARLFSKIEQEDRELAQYCVAMAHRLRFFQWENLRQSFWQIELRTIPEGHPDYRHVEQEKFRLLEKAYPSIAKHIRANMDEYDFARRGQEERIQKKMQQLL
ncbi:MAG: FAD-dependent thymidylate synthase [Candidatus Sungbacteria bacterium]|nr:FAD-dependent thymidylate synthase [Candidatus Sungbacteria bacterium]